MLDKMQHQPVSGESIVGYIIGTKLADTELKWEK